METAHLQPCCDQPNQDPCDGETQEHLQIQASHETISAANHPESSETSVHVILEKQHFRKYGSKLQPNQFNKAIYLWAMSTSEWTDATGRSPPPKSSSPCRMVHRGWYYAITGSSFNWKTLAGEGTDI